MLDSGYKHNVIPSTATGTVDARLLPGEEEAALATLQELAGPEPDEAACRRVAQVVGQFMATR